MVRTMPKISAQAAELRRTHILEAARQCFTQHGVQVSVDEICAKAGVSKGAFYLYFDSKDAAIEAIAKDHERVVASLGEPDTVEGLIERLVQLTNGSGTASNRLELETWSHALTKPSLRAGLQANANSLRQALAGSIGHICRKSPPKQSLPPAVTAEILTIFSMGLVAAAALGIEGCASSEIALRRLITTLLTGKPAASR
jgi:AcrR family transcriptional regulator